MLFWDLRVRKEDGSVYSSLVYPHSLSEGFGDMGLSQSFPPWVLFSAQPCYSGAQRGNCWTDRDTGPLLCDRLYKNKFG